jgi:pyruvate, orthophosphate dikinase
MFFDPRTRDALKRMILAKTQTERNDALGVMEPFQQQDFEDIFEAADGMPVTIRLLDPPLHEFLPPYHELVEEVALLRYTHPGSEKLAEKEVMLTIVGGMQEQNPMMGLRGCRAGIIYEGLTEMQTRAIFRAACRCAKRGIQVNPRVLIPMVSHVNEFKLGTRETGSGCPANLRRRGDHCRLPVWYLD